MRPKFTYVKILTLLLCFGFSTKIFGQVPTTDINTRISKNLRSIGLSKVDADNWIISSNYKDKSSGIEYFYIQQTYKSIKVFNNIITLAFKGENLLYSSGHFVNNITVLDKNATPTFQAGNAVSMAARHLNLKTTATFSAVTDRFQTEKKLTFSPAGIAKKEIETELLWVEDDLSELHLAWNVNIDVINSQDWWNVRVDAFSGEVINKNNWTVYEDRVKPERKSAYSIPKNYDYSPATFATVPKIAGSANSRLWAFNPPSVQNAAYLVVPFPYDSRNFGAVSLENNPWLKAGAGNDATTNGWHFDGTNNYNYSRGNNVYAYEDSANRNNPGRVVTSSTEPPSVTFDVSPDFSKQPFDTVNRNFGIVNLFYWNNIVHDVTYQYGFDENAGNFQTDNLGRGGSGNDAVRAEAQDGSGTNNANFSTGGDGSTGRMQMYLYYGRAIFNVTAPASIAGSYVAPESGLSLNNKLLKLGTVSGQVVLYNDAATTGPTHEACDSSVRPLNSVAGKIALMYRGNCPFTTKMRAAQNAGAIAVIVINNAASAVISMGGTDNAVTIPGVMISQSDGAKMVAELPNNVMVTMSTGILLDGDVDNGVITHEYGHGVSIRLTGGRLNGNCLGNAEQGGEGWSDYLALMLTTNWQNAQLTDGELARPMGTYTADQTATEVGIRRVPYSTDMLIDTLTYKSMDGNSAGNGEVHNIGEIWCSAVWDMTWNIIKQEGKISPDLYNSAADGGNIIALKLVMEGMKLQPCRPGFLDARNAILAADSILFNFRHKCSIWDAFARRGMGYSAVQGLSTNTGDQVPAFDVPSGISIKKTAVPTLIEAGSETSHNITVSCQCQVPANLYSISDTIPTGFTYVSSTSGSSLNGNVVKFSPISFSTPLASETVSVKLKAPGENCPITKPINDDRDVSQIGGLTNARIAGNTNWVSSTNRFYSTANAWYAADPSATTNFTLTSDNFTPGKLSILSFWHYYVTENGLDGGKVEISTDNGLNWLDAKPYFLQNGYNGLLNANAPQPNTSAFTGTSNATSSVNNGQFIQSIVDITSFAGQSVKIRFRFQTNGANASAQTYDGWYIDDITVSNGCGGINRIALLNPANLKVDSVSMPAFIVSVNAPLPLTLINFTAKQAGIQVLLNWETASEVNTKGFSIERSSDGISWTSIGSVDAKSFGTNKYVFNDQHPLDYLNHYRIRMYDQDGRFTYTIIKEVQFNTNTVFSIVPNPARDKVIVYFGFIAKGAEMQVTDIEGKIHQRHKIADNVNSYEINTDKLTSGTYFIRLQSKTGILTKKLVVTH